MSTIIEQLSTVIKEIKEMIPSLKQVWFLKGAYWAHEWNKKNLTDSDFQSEAEKQAEKMVNKNG